MYMVVLASEGARAGLRFPAPGSAKPPGRKLTCSVLIAAFLPLQREPQDYPGESQKKHSEHLGMNHIAKPWSAEEDAALRDHVQRYGPKKWDQAAQLIPGRTDKSCRLRYLNHLDSKVNKSPLTPEEDAMIVKAQQGNMKNRWSKIVKLMGNGRTDHQIKNRWYTCLKRIYERDEGNEQMVGSKSQSKRRRTNGRANEPQQKQYQQQPQHHQQLEQQLEQQNLQCELQHQQQPLLQEQLSQHQDLYQRLVSAAHIAALGGQHEASALLLRLADGVYSGHITQEQQQVLQELHFLQAAPQAINPSDTAATGTTEQYPPASPPPQLPAASTSGPRQHLQLPPLPAPPPPPQLPAASTSGPRQRPQPTSRPAPPPPPLHPMPAPPQPLLAAPADAPAFHTTATGFQAEQHPAASDPGTQPLMPKEGQAPVPTGSVSALTPSAETAPSFVSSLTAAAAGGVAAAAAAAAAATAPHLLPLTSLLSPDHTQAEARIPTPKPPQQSLNPTPPILSLAQTRPHSMPQEQDAKGVPESTPIAHSLLPEDIYVQHNQIYQGSSAPSAHTSACSMQITPPGAQQELLVQHQVHQSSSAPRAKAAACTTLSTPGVQQKLLVQHQVHQSSLAPSAKAAACTTQSTPEVQAFLAQHQLLQQERLQLGAFIQHVQQQGPVSEGLAAQLHSREQMLELQMGMLRGLITQMLAHPPDQHVPYTQQQRQQQQQVCSIGGTMPPSAKHPQAQPLSLASSSGSNAARTAPQIPSTSFSSGSSRSREKRSHVNGDGGGGGGGRSTGSKRTSKVGGKGREESAKGTSGKRGALKRAREGVHLVLACEAVSTAYASKSDVLAGFGMQYPQGFGGPHTRHHTCPQAPPASHPHAQLQEPQSPQAGGGGLPLLLQSAQVWPNIAQELQSPQGGCECPQEQGSDQERDLLPTHTGDPWYFGQLLGQGEALLPQSPPPHPHLETTSGPPAPHVPDLLSSLNRHEEQQLLFTAEQSLWPQSLMPLPPPLPQPLLQQMEAEQQQLPQHLSWEQTQQNLPFLLPTTPCQQQQQQQSDQPLLLPPLHPPLHPEDDALAGLPTMHLSPSCEDLFELAHWAMGPTDGDC